MPEEIKVDQGELVFDLILTKTGSRYNPAVIWQGADAQKITAKLIPQEALKGNGDGSFEFNWNVKNSAVKVENGAVSVNTEAFWIAEGMKKYPYTAEYEDEITVSAGALEKKIPVKLKFKLVDKTWSGSSGGRS